MNSPISQGEVGQVEREYFQFDELSLTVGDIKEPQLAYETYGQLNSNKNNAILIHAFSGDANAAVYHSNPKRQAGGTI